MHLRLLAVAVAAGLTVVASARAPVSAQTTTMDAMPVRTFVALEGPRQGSGIPVGTGTKHVTCTYHPPAGRIYCTGGDYRSGTRGVMSYSQETWSLSLAERWAQPENSAAGWRLEFPYCGPAGGLQPKHPDFVGWQWDAKRGIFWLVPGGFSHLEKGQESCANETPGPSDDAAFKTRRMFSFDPITRVWADLGTNIGPDPEDTWMTIFDPVKDQLIRMGTNGGIGGVANICKLTGTACAWRRVGLGNNALGKDVRTFKEYLAPDFVTRLIYMIDGVSGRLHTFHMDTYRTADLGPVPGGPTLIGGLPTSNYAFPVWNATSKVLEWFRIDGTMHVYHPSTKTWEGVPIVTQPGGRTVQARTAVRDEPNNVTLYFGGVETPNPDLYLFRYGPPR